MANNIQHDLSSIGSSAPDQRHISLIAASAQANEQRVREILGEDSPAWTSQMDQDALRQSLQKVAARGNLVLVRFLLEKGAEVNSRKESEVPALMKAAEGGHDKIVQELLKHKADINWKNRNGYTPLHTAAMRGHFKTTQILLDNGADTKIRDKEGRTPLNYLAAEKPGRWKMDMVQLLIHKGADIEARDQTRRTPLLWAAATGKLEFARLLLKGENGKQADISAYNNRGRTALHLAAQYNHEDMVKILLEHGANARSESDGGWTPLHNAAQDGHVEIVELLLNGNANVNAELSNGMTPLHWAAYNGHIDVVKKLLTRKNINLAINDSFDRTPMLCAAERYHKEIVQLLSPARAADRLTEDAKGACEGFEATVVDFGNFREGKKQLVFKHSVHELLYGWDTQNDKPKVPTLTRNVKYQPAFRWIHLPANNISWVEALVAKSFVEGGHRDIEDFKALERCFGQEHRGPTVHAHFMRTYCQRMAMPHHRPQDPEAQPKESDNEKRVDPKPGGNQPDTGATPKKPSAQVVPEQENDTPKSEAKKKTKAEQFAERHPKRAKRTNGPPTSKDTKDTKGGEKHTRQGPKDTTQIMGSNGKIVLFMPFLHYETDERRDLMSAAIKRAQHGRDLPNESSRDDMLVQAYLNATPPLHPRRTLDQFFYHGIDTSDRDKDQVVYRYCKRRGLEVKIFMVDQLWLWVLGKELIITCFPQRWDQPKNDPLNVLDGIIEDMNAKTRPPVQSVYDLAMLITTRCSGMFDRHRLDNENYQFLDMFESSIGHVTNRESKLFDRFNKASATAGKWLKRHRNARTPRANRVHSLSPHRRTDSQEETYQDHQDPIFVDALLDIGVETSLLAEIKDIRDELNIIGMVLSYQASILPEFADHIIDELRKDGSKKATDAVVVEIKKRSRDQLRVLDVHQRDLERMDKQAESIYTSLTHLLDLKQKHANAFEARFARDQAVTAGRQGQTVMVFTIVTIIFLPMSFIAAFFAISIEEFNAPLPLAYVAKYMFGIGLGISIPLIAMAFTVDDIVSGFRKVISGIQRLSRRRRKASEGDEYDDMINEKLETSSLPRGSVGYDNPRQARNLLSPDGFSPPAVPRRSLAYSDRDYEFANSGLSPASGRLAPPLTGRPRRYSGGRTTAVTWARASLDRGRRLGSGSRIDEDLERGRSVSSHRRAYD